MPSAHASAAGLAAVVEGRLVPLPVEGGEASVPAVTPIRLQIAALGVAAAALAVLHLAIEATESAALEHGVDYRALRPAVVVLHDDAAVCPAAVLHPSRARNRIELVIVAALTAEPREGWLSELVFVADAEPTIPTKVDPHPPVAMRAGLIARAVVAAIAAGVRGEAVLDTEGREVLHGIVRRALEHACCNSAALVNGAAGKVRPGMVGAGGRA